jgi:hypothetical protein
LISNSSLLPAAQSFRAGSQPWTPATPRQAAETQQPSRCVSWRVRCSDPVHHHRQLTHEALCHPHASTSIGRGRRVHENGSIATTHRRPNQAALAASVAQSRRYATTRCVGSVAARAQVLTPAPAPAAALKASQTHTLDLCRRLPARIVADPAY